MQNKIILFSLIIILLFLTGCINGKEKKIDALDIHVENGTNNTYNVTVIIINSQGAEIFNKSFSIYPYSQIDFKDITDRVDNYVLTIKLDDGRIKMNDNIAVSKYRHMVGIHIDYDDIKISQKVE